MPEVLKAGRKNTLTNKQSEYIFDKVFKPYMKNYHDSLNFIDRTPDIAVYIDTEDVVCVAIEPAKISNVKELVFSPRFFKNQIRGMVIARANEKGWTNTRLREEFARGMKVEFNKRYLNKNGKK